MTKDLSLPQLDAASPSNSVADVVGKTTSLQSAPMRKNDNNANPSYAGEDDVIEKEWVDRAKKIITQTKGDPHAQAEGLSLLQVDYLKKRYGKEIGV